MTAIVAADERAILTAAEMLKQGRLVAFPTETVYGLGADAANPEAIRRIFTAKGRPAEHPLIVHIENIEQLNDWAIQIPESAIRLAERFWPGPLAIILKKKPEVPPEVTGGQNTVGLRIPGNPVALKLLKAFAGGIAAPSANRFKHISPTLASHVLEELGGRVDLILDGGACSVGVESTIIDLSGCEPCLLRPGHISVAELEAVLQVKVTIPGYSDTRAPGMMAVHYAPVTQSWLCPGDRLPAILAGLSEQSKKVGLIKYQYQAELTQIHTIQMPEQAEFYAQSLYASLRQLDRLNLDLILVEQPPISDAWRAINDRLEKATEPCQTLRFS